MTVILIVMMRSQIQTGRALVVPSSRSKSSEKKNETRTESSKQGQSSRLRNAVIRKVLGVDPQLAHILRG